MQLSANTSLCAAGPRSSAVVGGYTLLHQELERRLAALKGTEECLLFSTGFAANLAVVSALGNGEGAAIFSDELNHASIVDGSRLASRSKASLIACLWPAHRIYTVWQQSQNRAEGRLRFM